MPEPRRDRPRILLVDDEPRVLEGLRRQLHRHYEAVFATDACRAIHTFTHDGPFPVVVSDLRMPRVDGVSLLAKIASIEPDTVRVLLTGHADLDAAADAVNRGRVFRFLTKPCSRETLLGALGAAIEQHRLVRSERELLERTLRGAVRTLTDVLALASPLAFGRAQRIARTARQIHRATGGSETWPIEVAALLSQIGGITLMHETLERLHRGEPLSETERRQVERVPGISQELLRHVPRLEPVLEILENLHREYHPCDVVEGVPRGEEIPLGARVLRIALDFDDLELEGRRGPRALGVMRGRGGRYDPDLLDALEGSRNFDGEGREIRQVQLQELSEGMILGADVTAPTGVVLAARGLTVGPGLLLRLQNFAEKIGVQEPVVVALPDPSESPPRPVRA